jgi:hypothetical protein
MSVNRFSRSDPDTTDPLRAKPHAAQRELQQERQQHKIIEAAQRRASNQWHVADEAHEAAEHSLVETKATHARAGAELHLGRGHTVRAKLLKNAWLSVARAREHLEERALEAEQRSTEASINRLESRVRNGLPKSALLATIFRLWWQRSPQHGCVCAVSVRRNQHRVGRQFA